VEPSWSLKVLRLVVFWRLCKIMSKAFLRDRQGVSPLLAAIILIAIVVAGGVVVYNVFFSASSTISKTASIEITHVELIKGSSHCMFSISVRNVGTQEITWCNAHIWGNNGQHYWWGMGGMQPGQSRGGSWMVDRWNFQTGRTYIVQVDFGTADGGYFSTSTSVTCRS
jgi:flagellin-like protein